MKTVNDILLRKGPPFNVIEPDASVVDALSLMSCENLDHVIVMIGDHYLGILCEHDYTRKLLVPGIDLQHVKVREIMNSYLPILSMDESLERCMKLMDQFHTRHLPVFDEMVFRGVITMDDIIKEAVFNRDIFDLDRPEVAVTELGLH
ncbi:MAG TPA: CBS domain-containing protein [Parasegetibacter sp.]